MAGTKEESCRLTLVLVFSLYGRSIHPVGTSLDGRSPCNSAMAVHSYKDGRRDAGYARLVLPLGLIDNGLIRSIASGAGLPGLANCLKVDILVARG